MQTHGRRQSGMTITELLISMTVLAVVIGWVMVAYTEQHTTQLNHERVVEAQHEGRLITDLMVADLRMAGFMLPVQSGLASVDGGANASDQICMSDPAVMDATIVANANQRFTGVPATLAGSTGTVNVNAADLDVDSDGDVDFAAGAGIILADGDNAHCAVVTSVAGGTIQFSPTTPGGFAINAPDGFIAPAVFYQIAGNDLTRNGTVLSSNVEDVQIEYWVDTNSDSVMDQPAEFPLHDLNGEDVFELRLARVSITSRTEIPEAGMQGLGFTAVANRVAGAPDNFKRRRQSAETLLRNMR